MKKSLSKEEILQSLSLPIALQQIICEIKKASGQAILVGGAVRDLFLNIPSKDLDIEIYALELGEIESILKKFGKVNFIGKSFGIMLMVLDGLEIDFSIPRIEKKIASGHCGFDIEYKPSLSFEQASSRRDFTINAMGIDLHTYEVLDPHKGLDDLSNKRLKHVSNAFGEDSLRALRAVQFAARFELSIDDETQSICRKQSLDELPAERLYEEFKKLLLKSLKPSLGMEWMRKMDLLRFFPELQSLIGVPQDEEWHPEGDVWTHNNMVLDQAAIILRQESFYNQKNGELDAMAFMLGALCHDLGKPLTTIKLNGRWRSPAHDIKGVAVTTCFLKRLTKDQKLIKLVTSFVKEHLRPSSLYRDRDKITEGAMRRLSLRVDIPALIRIAKADHLGRTTKDALANHFPAGKWLAEQFEKLGLDKSIPKPILTGKILQKYGFPPGPIMGKIIKQSFEEQLDGKIKDEDDLTIWLKKYYIN